MNEIFAIYKSTLFPENDARDAKCETQIKLLQVKYLKITFALTDAGNKLPR